MTLENYKICEHLRSCFSLLFMVQNASFYEEANSTLTRFACFILCEELLSVNLTLNVFEKVYQCYFSEALNYTYFSKKRLFRFHAHRVSTGLLALN